MRTHQMTADFMLVLVYYEMQQQSQTFLSMMQQCKTCFKRKQTSNQVDVLMRPGLHSLSGQMQGLLLVYPRSGF